MSNSEEIYNQALDMLKKGHSKEEILVKFASERNELAALLDVSLGLLSIPKNLVPTPLMQRKYAAVPVKSFWLAWLHVSKFAGVSMSVMLLISALTVMGYQASKAGPGQALFALRKQAEQLKVILASDQDAKASLQIQLTQQRLDEAQAIFGDPTSNLEQKKAALSELSSQTSSAVAQVVAAAKNDPSPNKNNPLLSVLDNLTKKQKSLLAEIKPGSAISSDAQAAQLPLDENTAKLSQVKESVVAASNSQVLTSLSAEPNAVVVYGEITQLSKEQISIEKLTFNFGPQTSIKNDNGNDVDPAKLSLGQKAKVIGVKNQNALLAEQVLVTFEASQAAGQPEVKGAASSTPPASDPKAGSQSTTPTSLKKPELQTSLPTIGTGSPAADQSQGTASGLFIYEDPSPQFAK